jgi:hypothetical protein
MAVGITGLHYRSRAVGHKYTPYKPVVTGPATYIDQCVNAPGRSRRVYFGVPSIIIF